MELSEAIKGVGREVKSKTTLYSTIIRRAAVSGSVSPEDAENLVAASLEMGLTQESIEADVATYKRWADAKRELDALDSEVGPVKREVDGLHNESTRLRQAHQQASHNYHARLPALEELQAKRQALAAEVDETTDANPRLFDVNE